MKIAKIMGKRVKVASTVDATGLFCPMPVVKLKLELEERELFQVIELLADDPGVLKDLPAWCRETGNTLLSLEENSEGLFVAYVKKTEE
jgi:TusA-related sulfurtransferase